jgi:hypothetical protein
LSNSSAAADGKASLSAESQRYTVRALRTAFAWWFDVRYLAGNPSKAVNDPLVVKRASAMKMQRALPPICGPSCATSWTCDQTKRAASNGGRCALRFC